MKFIIYCSSDGTFYSNRYSDEWSTDSLNAHKYESRAEAQRDVDDFADIVSSQMTILEVDVNKMTMAGVHQADCAHRADNGFYCLRPKGHKGLHHRLATVWSDDGKSRLITSADNNA